MSDLLSFVPTLLAFVGSYLLHSTLFLLGCWLLLTMCRTRSHVLRERLWKGAAVLGFVTAGLQMVVGRAATIELGWSGEPEVAADQRPAVSSQPLAVEPQSSRADGERATVAMSSSAADSEPSQVVLHAPASSLQAVSSEFQVSADETDLPPDLDQGVDAHGEMTRSDTPSSLTAEHSVVSTQYAADDRLGRDAETDDWSTPSVITAAVPVGVAADDKLANAPHVTLASVTQRALQHLTIPVAVAVPAVFLLGGGLFVIQSLRMRKHFGDAVLVVGIARRVLDRFLRKHKVRRRVRLFAASDCTEPVTYGLFRWTIVVPVGIEDRVSREELDALLAHEVAHLVRGDVRWLWIGRVLCSCCAFQPLNFVARRRWQQAAEYLCDDWAVTRGIRAIALARCLTRIAEWRFGEQVSEVGLAAGGSKATLVRRVERLVAEPSGEDAWAKPIRRRAVTMSAVIVVVATVLLMPGVAVPESVGWLGRSATSPWENGDTPAALDASQPSLVASEASVDKPNVSDVPSFDARPSTLHAGWHGLQEELLQLEASLDRASDLLRQSPRDQRLTSLVKSLGDRARMLRARRERIDSSFRKDSER